MDRRTFLFGAFKEAPADGSSGTQAGSGRAEGASSYRIGRLADLPAGETRRFGNGSIIVESLPEGLRARSGERGGPCYEISADQIGGLSVNLSRIWNEDTVFSIMIGGPTRLEPSMEGNNERR